ncbi:ABC transporter substrate-binding protein [Paenibacillus sp. FSL R5-0912]|uniref:ABC transporter substrate-binding protein n=1 Tax=Paenibacillus sp. FSL R5-0912 TaxID=1536771 RepID=UPI0004F71661|nr:ABC transporter substrate-binding protein [Paenibacillus sp. FSL R5-0912]AIQ42497.1 peptide ABC transporter substrate-binding protein [Paenibacillus sp. FSL R5-0912]
MTKRKWTSGLLTFLVAAVVLSGCGGNNATGGNTAQSAAPAAGSNTAEQGSKVLTIANITDIESFDPHNNNNTVSESVLVNVFDYLLKNDSEQKKVPGLATSWEQVDDTTWRFHLREGVTFHNGDPFTAADVKYTIERVAKDSALKQNSYFKNIVEVKAVDDLTVDIITTGPDPLLLNRLSKMGAGILPSKYIEENGIDAFLKQPVGTGPYKFSKWTKDDRVELVKNDNYFDGAPKWDEVVFRSIPEASTRVSELLAGGIDIAAGIPSTDVARVEDADRKQIVKAPIQRVLQLILRQTEGSPTADPKVREAIDLSIDKQGIVDSIAGGAGIVTRTSVTPGNFGADASLYKQSLYDQAKAKELLKEAGYAEGSPELTISVSSQYKEYSEVVAAMLEQTGFKVNLDVLEPSAFSERYSSKSFKEIFMIGIGNSLFDASNNYNRFLAEEAKGETDYNNPEVEKLLQQALVNMDPASREEEYKQVQQILADDRPAVYLFQMEGIYGTNDRVTFTPRSDEMFFAEEITPANE